MRELLTFISEHKTKLLGALTTFLSTLTAMIASGMFEGLLPDSAIRWVSILSMLVGATITGVGFSNTTKERVAGAMETAIKATPQLVCLMAAGLLLSFMLTGCVTEQPQGFRDRAVIAEQSVNGVIQSTTNSLEAGAISSEDAIFVRDLAKRARELLGLAETAYEAGDLTTATGRLALAEGVLRELQARVRPKR